MTVPKNEDGSCPDDTTLCQDGSVRDPDKGCKEDWCDDAMTIPKDEQGNCPEGPTGCDAVDCTQPRPDDELGLGGVGLSAAQLWDNCCTDNGGTTCQDGSTPDPDKGCKEDWCDDAMTIPKNEDGSCPEGPVEECVKPDGTPTGATVESGCEECPQGQDFNKNGVCAGPTKVICDDRTATNYGEEGECVFGPDPVICDDRTATNYGEEGMTVQLLTMVKKGSVYLALIRTHVTMLSSLQRIHWSVAG
jgi:hypothetical protein